MRIVFLTLFLTCLSQLNAQLLSGDLVDSGRKISSSTNFTFEGNASGVLVYELAVDREGRVTAVAFKSAQSTINSTPVKMEAENFLKGLVFQPGTAYPKFQHVLVQLNYKKKELK